MKMIKKIILLLKKSLSSFNLNRMRINVKSAISQDTNAIISLELASLLRKNPEDTSTTQLIQAQVKF